MAYIDIEEVIEYLDNDIKKALEQALQNYGIEETVDRNRLHITEYPDTSAV